jgi:hypothetical protein
LLAILGLAGCDDSVRIVGPGTAASIGEPGDEDTAAPQSEPERWASNRWDRDGTCTAYVGSGWDQGSMESECGGPVTSDGCPGSSLGNCRYQSGEPQEYVEWFYEGTYYSTADVTSLRATCESNFGTWE